MLTRLGFQHELHNCTARDGYTTQLVRMVNPFVKRAHLRKVPVMLYTGQGVSPAAFLAASLDASRPTKWNGRSSESDEQLFGEGLPLCAANRSLAVMLSNNGFDVWLVPTRGIDVQNRGRLGPLLAGAGGSSSNGSSQLEADDTDLAGLLMELLEAKQTTTKKKKLLPAALAAKSGHHTSGSKQHPTAEAAASNSTTAVAHDEADGASSSAPSVDWLEKLRWLAKRLAVKNYWSFSSDEIIDNELELQIETVRSACNSSKVSVVSYSNGGFVLFGYLSKRPAYAQQHIDAVVSLAPAVFVNKLNLVLGLAGLASQLNPPDWPFLEDHVDAFLRDKWTLLCKSKPVRYSLCKKLLNELYGPSELFSAQLDLAIFDFIARPLSANGLRQTLQASCAGKMRKYDYGLLGNLVFYGQPEPDAYELQSVSHDHLYVLAGDQDAIVDQNSLAHLLGSIACKPEAHIQIPTYNHLDLLIGHDNAERVNLPVLRFLVDRDIELDYYQYESNDDEQDDHDNHDEPGEHGEYGEHGEHGEHDEHDEHEDRGDRDGGYGEHGKQQYANEGGSHHEDHENHLDHLDHEGHEGNDKHEEHEEQEKHDEHEKHEDGDHDGHGSQEEAGDGEHGAEYGPNGAAHEEVDTYPDQPHEYNRPVLQPHEHRVQHGLGRKHEHEHEQESEHVDEHVETGEHPRGHHQPRRGRPYKHKHQHQHEQADESSQQPVVLNRDTAGDMQRPGTVATVQPPPLLAAAHATAEPAVLRAVALARLTPPADRNQSESV
jgi:pimeloyl-ACP methyl ester carboxylesterase